jgi:predicted NBD/HSP70 family sugar kinase
MASNRYSVRKSPFKTASHDNDTMMSVVRRTRSIGQVMRGLNSGSACTRSDLARILGLNKSTMTYVVGYLLDSGIVEEVEREIDSPKVGRRPVHLSIRDDRILAGGIAFEEEHYSGIVVDNSGRVRLRLTGKMLDTHDPARSLAAAYDDLTQRAQEAALPVFGVGAAVGGIVDPAAGRIIRSDALNISDYDLYTHIHNRERPRLLVDNDANCGAWGELFSRTHEGSDFLFVLGRCTEEYLGVGFGLAINGSVYYGRRFRAGEFSSAWAHHSRVSQFSISPKELSNNKEDKVLFKKVIIEFLKSLSPILALLDPERVILGGFFRGREGLVREVLAADLSDSYVAATSDSIVIDKPAWGKDELVVGAAGMVIKRLFASPTESTSDGRNTVTWDELFFHAGTPVQVKDDQGSQQG